MPRHFGILVPSTNTTGEIDLVRAGDDFLRARAQAHAAHRSRSSIPMAA